VLNKVDPSRVYRLFYPAVPAVVSCNDRGLVYSMPVVSIIPLSNDPAIIGFASSPQHATHVAISQVRSFSVCWLDSSKVEAVKVLGSTGHTAPDKLKAAGLPHSRGKTLDVPIVEGSAAALECTLYHRQVIGDHELVIGKVQAAWAIDDFQEYWKFERYRPLLYTGLQGGALGTHSAPGLD